MAWCLLIYRVHCARDEWVRLSDAVSTAGAIEGTLIVLRERERVDVKKANNNPGHNFSRQISPVFVPKRMSRPHH